MKQREALGQFQKENQKRLAGKIREYRKRYLDTQKERDSLYEDYADGRMDAQEYRIRADWMTEQMKELSERADEAEKEYDRLQEVSGKAKEEMKQIIRYAHIEELTQEVVDVFIRRGDRL